MPAELKIKNEIVFEVKQKSAIRNLVRFETAPFPMGGFRTWMHRKEWIEMVSRKGRELAAGQCDAICFVETIGKKCNARNAHFFHNQRWMLREHRGRVNK